MVARIGVERWALMNFLYINGDGQYNSQVFQRLSPTSDREAGGAGYVGLALDRVDPLVEDAPIPMMSHKAGLNVINCAYLVGFDACRSASTSVRRRVQTEGPQ